MPVTDHRQPGDFAVCPISGWGGAGIGWGERWLAHGRAAATGAFDHWRHAVVYVGGGRCLQAEPGGSQLITRPVMDGDLWSTGYLDPPDPGVRERAEASATMWEHIPYSALDYLALAAHRARIPNLPVWPGRGHLVNLQQFIGTTGHMMCSQLVDAFLAEMGWHLFTSPPRWPGFVDPYDLGALIQAATVKGM
jgi:hypothetical protein